MFTLCQILSTLQIPHLIAKSCTFIILILYMCKLKDKQIKKLVYIM